MLISSGKALSILEREGSVHVFQEVPVFCFWLGLFLGQEGCGQRLWLIRVSVLPRGFLISSTSIQQVFI